MHKLFLVYSFVVEQQQNEKAFSRHITVCVLLFSLSLTTHRSTHEGLLIFADVNWTSVDLSTITRPYKHKVCLANLKLNCENWMFEYTELNVQVGLIKFWVNKFLIALWLAKFLNVVGLKAACSLIQVGFINVLMYLLPVASNRSWRGSIRCAAAGCGRSSRGCWRTWELIKSCWTCCRCLMTRWDLSPAKVKAIKCM